MRSWGGHEQRGGRETLVGEVGQGVPAMGPLPEVHEQKVEGSEGKGPRVSARAG